jgi:hypothetical protein
MEALSRLNSIIEDMYDNMPHGGKLNFKLRALPNTLIKHSSKKAKKYEMKSGI